MSGYYVMRYSGERYQLVAWFLHKLDAEIELAEILNTGNWQGKSPKVVTG